jgi:hypothetical protein
MAVSDTERAVPAALAQFVARRGFERASETLVRWAS